MLRLFLSNKHREIGTIFSLFHAILHVSPEEGAVVSVWFSPAVADRCWAAPPQCSSAGDSRKQAQSKESPVNDRINLNLQ